MTQLSPFQAAIFDMDGTLLDTEALFKIALAEGVAYIPGNAFSAEGRFPDALRLCFASTPPDRIREGVRRLRAAVDRQRAEG